MAVGGYFVQAGFVDGDGVAGDGAQVTGLPVGVAGYLVDGVAE